MQVIYYFGSRSQSKPLVTLTENSVYVHQKHSLNYLIIMQSIDIHMNQSKCIVNLVL